jgi:cation/acetate symporter
MTVGNPAVNIAIFAAFVVATLVIVLRASRNNRTAADFYGGGRAFSGPQNGIAISGDYLSAASFLGIAGAIALNGYDGFLYSIGFLVAWLVALLLVAELLRNTGRFTMADVLSFRLRQRPVRTAAATSTLVVSFFYLLAQMAGADGLVALLLGVSGRAQQGLVIAGVGAVMIAYVLIGGMKGTTWVQIIKATLLVLGAATMTVWVLAEYRFNLSSLLGAAVDRAGAGRTSLLEPGRQYGATRTSKLDFLSLALALVFGTAGLPHILMRFYTVPTAREARRSVVWAIWIIGVFYLFTLVLGYGAAALVGPQRILAAPGRANSAAPLLAYELGGTVLLGLIAAVAFATILAVVAGLTITASASFAHDVYANVIKRGNVRPEAEVRVARLTAVVIGVVAIVGGILANGQNVAFLVARRSRWPRRPTCRPADHRLLAVLAAVHHPRCAVEHLRRPRLVPAADRLLAGGVRQARGRKRPERLDDHRPDRRLLLVPAGQPGAGDDPAGVPPRLAGHGDQPQAPGLPGGGGDGGPFADRCRRGARGRALTRPSAQPARASTASSIRARVWLQPPCVPVASHPRTRSSGSSARKRVNSICCPG